MSGPDGMSDHQTEGVVVVLPTKPATAARSRPARPLVMTPGTLDAFDTVAWRPPGVRRFDSRPANDQSERRTFAARLARLPFWIMPLAGALLAGLAGLSLAGWLSL